MKPRPTHILVLVASTLVVPGCAHGADHAPSPTPDSSAPTQTTWRIEPSLKYDTLCLLNTLTGDPYYTWRYPKAHLRFSLKLTPAARQALAGLRRVIKDEGQGIISAWLCLYFSATDDETLAEMKATLHDPTLLRERFEKTPYWNEEGWQRFDSIRADLTLVLTWLEQIDFEAYWRDEVRPAAARRAEQMLRAVTRYDIVPEIERHLGRPLESDTITVYMLTYSQPHGIKITGTRFLTDVAWPFEIVVRNAVHEMMHPPCTWKGDDELAALVESLRQDPFLMDKVEHHNPSFGYNSLEGFVEEDCVQALEQRINERLGVAEDARRRWRKSDDGMHVLAVALYQLMTEQDYPSRDKSFRDFLVRMHAESRLKPGAIEEHHRSMYGG